MTFAVTLVLLSAPVLAHAADPWSGIYGGINAGYAFDGKSTLNFPRDGGGHSLFSPFAGGAVEHTLRGSAWGLHLGQNRRFGNVVFGIEGSYSVGDIDGASNNAFGLPAVATPNSHTTKIKSLATLTPRLGYAAGNWMPYAKAGLAAAEISSSLSNTVVPERPLTFDRKHLHDGWTAGLGVEYALGASASGAWILGLEYNYYQFSGRTYGGQVIPNNLWPVQYTVKPAAQTVMAKLSYNFGARGTTGSSTGS